MKDKFVKLQKDYKKLYPHGLIGVAENYIQVDCAFFKKNFSASKRRFSGTDLELSTCYKEVEFIALISPDNDEEKEQYFKEIKHMQ